MNKTVTVISCIFIALIGFSLIEKHTFWGVILIIFAVLALIGGLSGSKAEKSANQESSENALSPETMVIAKKRRKKIVLIVIAVSLWIALIVIVINDKSEVQPEEKHQSTKKELVESQFNSWDGSHRKLTELIKASMNDADSYEHVKTVWILDTDSTIYVTTKFRGSNAFGAKVLNQISARFTVSGDIIEIIQ